jgi:hypothetical protein
MGEAMTDWIAETGENIGFCEKHRQPLNGLPSVFRDDKPTLRQIQNFVDGLKADKGNLGKDPFPLKRELADGFYTREVHIPAGHLLAGAIHRKDSFVMMKSGKLIVAAAGESTVLTGPCMFMSSKGKQKIGYAVEDTVWVDIHRTDAKTIEEADAELFTEDYNLIARDDYADLLIEMDVTEEHVLSIVGDMSDHIDFNRNYENRVDIAKSDIQGRGIFTLREFEAGTLIVPTRIGNRRTYAGRYTNHSPNPNVVGKLFGDDIYFVAVNDIAAGDELTVDYRQARQVACEADKQLSRG